MSAESSVSKSSEHAPPSVRAQLRALLGRLARWAFYPCFYASCLAAFTYLLFPWDGLKNALVRRFAEDQRRKGRGAWQLEIEHLSGYWFTGVEAENVRVVIPAGEGPEPSSGSAAHHGPTRLTPELELGGSEAPKAVAAPTEIVFSRATARVELLPLLIGRVRIDVRMDGLGGVIHGVVPMGGGTLTADMEHVELAKIRVLRETVSLPVSGTADGHVELTADDGNWVRSRGKLSLSISDAAIGDGKEKLLGKATLPRARLGDVEISATVADGIIRLERFEAAGTDMSASAQGTVRIRDPWTSSVASGVVRFSFTDVYRATNDETRGLLGDPVDPTSMPAIDFIPRMKKAKGADGSWSFTAKGGLSHLRWVAGTEGSPGAGPKPGGRVSQPRATSSSRRPLRLRRLAGARLVFLAVRRSRSGPCRCTRHLEPLATVVVGGSFLRPS